MSLKRLLLTMASFPQEHWTIQTYGGICNLQISFRSHLVLFLSNTLESFHYKIETVLRLLGEKFVI